VSCILFRGGNASAYVCRGVAQAQLGNLAAAVKDLRFAVVLDPKAIGPRLNLVIALGRSGADVEARALLSDLARESPNDPEVRSILKAVDPSQP